jgi:hypothetical protein
MKIKSWKTTVAGVAAALGFALTQVDGLPQWAKLAGAIMTAFGLTLGGVVARDFNVSSEDHGIRK